MINMFCLERGCGVYAAASFRLRRGYDIIALDVLNAE